MPEAVYQATKAATAGYQAAYEQAMKARKDALAEFLEQHGFHPDTSVYAHEEGTGRVVGVQSDTVPAGWRADRQHPGAIVPALRTRHGKAIEKALAAIPHSDGRALLPGGMPHHCIAGHVLMHPSIETPGGRLYVGWPRALPEKVQGRLDGTVWREVLLSTYHRAREQHALTALLQSHDSSGVITGDHDPATLAHAIREHYIVTLPNGLHLITVEGMSALDNAA